MHTPDLHLLTGTDEVCFRQMHDLEEAIQSAIVAIANDAVEELENSLWKQQVLCSGLQRSLESITVGGATPDLIDRVSRAMSTLHSANRTYAALVQQAQVSANLLLKLCSSYEQPASSTVLSPMTNQALTRTNICMA